MSIIYKQKYISGDVQTRYEQQLETGSIIVGEGAVVRQFASPNAFAWNISGQEQTVLDTEAFTDTLVWYISGSGTGSSNVDDLVIDGNSRLRVDEDGTLVGTGIEVAQGSTDNKILASKGYVDSHPGEANVQADWAVTDDTASTYIANKPNITTDANTIVMNGEVDFGVGTSRTLNIGHTGDIHFTDGSDVKMFFDMSTGMIYYDHSNTLTLTTSTNNELATRGSFNNLEIGATTFGHVDHPGDATEEAVIAIGYGGTVLYRLPVDVEITSVAATDFIPQNQNGKLPFAISDMIQANDEKPITSKAVHEAGYQLSSDVDSAIDGIRTSSSLLTFPDGSTFTGTSGQIDLGLTLSGGDIVTDKDIVFESGTEIHFIRANGTLDAQIDLSDSGNALRIETDNNRDIELLPGGTGKAYVGDNIPANEIVTVGTQNPGGGVTKSATLSSTDLPNPQEGDVAYLTADWTDTSGATDVKYYEGLFTYNGSLWVGVLNLPTIASGYPAGTYTSTVPFLNDSTMLVEEITNAGIHRVNSNFELVGNWQTRTEDTNALILDINVGNDSGDIDVYDGDGEVVMHLDSSGKKMYYGTNINTTSLSANDEIATIGDLSGLGGFNPTEYDPTQVYQTGAFVTSDGELFQCTATTTAQPGNSTIETEGDNWRSITETLASVDSVATFPLLTPDNSIIRVGEIMCVINDPSPYNNGLYRVITHNASGTSVARVDELDHLHEIVEGIIQHSGSSASFEFPDDNPAFITGTLVDETKFTTVEGTKSTTIPSLDTVGPKFEPENGRMTLIYSNLSDEQITQLEAAVGSDLAFRTTAGGVVTAGNVEDTDNAVAAQSTYHFLLKSVSYRLGTGRRQLNFVMRDLSQATDFVSAFSFEQNTGITGNALNLYIPTDGPLVTNLIDNIALVTIVAISGGGSGNSLTTNEQLALTGLVDLPNNAFAQKSGTGINGGSVVTGVALGSHIGEITVTTNNNGTTSTANIGVDHIVFSDDTTEWNGTGTPDDSFGHDGQLALSNVAAAAYIKRSGSWSSYIFPSTQMATSLGDLQIVIDQALTGNSLQSVLEPDTSGSSMAIRANGNGNVIVEDVSTINNITFDAVTYTAMLVGVGSAEITTTAAGYETNGLSYTHNSITYYRLFLTDGTGEILTTDQNNTDAGDIVYSKTY